MTDRMPGFELDEVVHALKRIRARRARDENGEMHGLIAAQLDAASIYHEREVRIGRGCRLDFLTFLGVAIEAKRLRPNAARVWRQLERYAAHPRVRSIVLVVERSIPLPESLHGKPVRQVATQALWGVAV